MQSGPDNKQWDAVYAMAVKAYGLETKFNPKQAGRYAAWRQGIIDQISAGSGAYLRPVSFNAVLGLLFPALVPALASRYGLRSS